MTFDFTRVREAIMTTQLVEEGGLRIAVEGCCHGALDVIYAAVQKSCEVAGWDGVDAVLIGGDFQAVRNAHDLNVIAIPPKYREMMDFHEYYSGAKTAPYLTIFIGGNHEASSHLWELFYGGWAAPNIYYMGAANVVRLGPLRIAGLSGIWKGYNYRKPHFERLPFSEDDMRSFYHVREWDVRRLLQIRSQVDIGLSHDWPRSMEWKGDHQQLFRIKRHFEQEAKDGSLGSVAAKLVLERLRPAYWFSAHMHVKYGAIWKHDDPVVDSSAKNEDTPMVDVVKNEDEIDLDLDDTPTPAAVKNEDEIDLGLDFDDTVTPAGTLAAAQRDPDAMDIVDGKPKETKEAPGTANGTELNTTVNPSTDLEDVISTLPESFAPRSSRESKPPSLPFPSEITNRETKFLALDKPMPNRDFLQLLSVQPFQAAEAEFTRPLALSYDKEWLAITRVFASELQLGDRNAQVPPDEGDAQYRPLIEQEMQWVEEHLVKPGKMQIPADFEHTAPVYDPAQGDRVPGQPEEYTNPHTARFCELLQIPNPFHATMEDRRERVLNAPPPSSSGGDRGGRGGGGGRGNYNYRGGNSSRGRRGGRGGFGSSFNPNAAPFHPRGGRGSSGSGWGGRGGRTRG